MEDIKEESEKKKEWEGEERERDKKSCEMNFEGANQPCVWLCSLTSSLVHEGDQAPPSLCVCVCGD